MQKILSILKLDKKSYLVAIFIAPLFFYIIYIGHFLNHAPELNPTGFISLDMPYYSAQGREIFENGNGFSYPNAYSGDGPVIYFHWLFWLLGFGIKVLGFDPGYQFVFFGLISSFIMSWISFKIIDTILLSKRFIVFFFLLMMWGGSFFVLVKIIFNIATGVPIYQNPLAFDAFYGAWGLNWGRSMIYPPEALYHVIFAGTWLSLLKNKWSWSIVGALLLSSTHPFSGVQLTLIVFFYFIYLFIREKDKIFLYYAIATFFILILLFFYYFLFLNSFEEHTSVHQAFKLETWVLPWHTLLIAYFPMGMFVLWRMLKDFKKITHRDWIFIISFIVSIGLVKHDLFFSPIQPLHFTRGYVWTPLFLLALPLFQELIIKLHKNHSNVVAFLTIIMVFFLVILDNLTFVRILASSNVRGIFITSGEKEIFSWIDEENLYGTMLSDQYMTGYLSATYTGITPYLGYWFLTPNYELRKEQITEWRKTGEVGDWLSSIDYILLRRSNSYIQSIETKDWHSIYENEEFVLFERISTKP